MLNDWCRRAIAAGVSTRTTDVEGEVNGLMTYDRRVARIQTAELARMLFAWFRKQAARAPTSASRA